jgi:hypothetical protein
MSAETEQFRQELIAGRGDGETDADLRARYAPGSAGCHEALHMAAFLERAVSGELLEHGAVLANPAWFALAERAAAALADLYQAIGAAHMDPERGAKNFVRSAK